jgi:DNA-directed RNA polymerase II subunit RPB2
LVRFVLRSFCVFYNELVLNTLVPCVSGDKFSSRHGQKGTVGQTLTAENMPFTSSGMNPDIIINPHCLPSRMTVGHILETVTGKISALKPKRKRSRPNVEWRTGDAFQGHDLAQTLMRELKDCGFEKYGNETLHDPVTGKAFRAKIFMGPVYYQRLKHMVEDKIHARAHGRVVAMTRQPTEGRAQGGGLRFGEMEKDCMIAHGASAFLNGRLHLDSDPYTVQVCKNCGNVADVRNKWGDWSCLSCTSKQQGTLEIKLPYAAKLLLQELRAMNIGTKMVV